MKLQKEIEKCMSVVSGQHVTSEFDVDPWLQKYLYQLTVCVHTQNFYHHSWTPYCHDSKVLRNGDRSTTWQLVLTSWHLLILGVLSTGSNVVKFHTQVKLSGKQWHISLHVYGIHFLLITHTVFVVYSVSKKSVLSKPGTWKKQKNDSHCMYRILQTCMQLC